MYSCRKFVSHISVINNLLYFLKNDKDSESEDNDASDEEKTKSSAYVPPRLVAMPYDGMYIHVPT